ncbi:hypothetical protein L1987_32728 [Smallanthus sonchifolius]|uniref:Uncharacterized protein n=1 Tax=Smallanthus sonchifolius TaxID=185202 RepID=A0ACB9HQE2_9ASTR|nr:hypothetical protein L1987_32728 [Smallanthus sonchifolius]
MVNLVFKADHNICVCLDLTALNWILLLRILFWGSTEVAIVDGVTLIIALVNNQSSSSSEDNDDDDGNDNTHDAASPGVQATVDNVIFEHEELHTTQGT